MSPGKSIFLYVLIDFLSPKEEFIMLNQEIAKLINEQINFEFYSAYVYLSYANYYAEEGLDGFANWYTIQTQEEKDHAFLMMKYLQNNGEKVILEDIRKPDNTFSNHKMPLVLGLEHEREVTKRIHHLYDAAYSIKDFRTMQFLDWFIKEQGEEEMNVDTLIKKFELFGSDSKSLYLMDTELAARVYTAPSLVL
jgi:ferritin